MLFILVLIPSCLFCQSAEKENLNRVIRTLSASSIPFEARSLLADYGGFGTSLLVRSPVKPEGIESTGSFVFAVPLRADFAVNTALALAKKIGESGSLNNILVAFLGDEANALPQDLGGIQHKGLRDLLTLTDMPENWMVCYLDADEAPEELVIRHGIRKYVAPMEIVKPLPFLFASADIPWSFRIRHNEIYKLGLVEGPSALFVIWGEEVNGFVLSGIQRSGKLGNNPEKKISFENLAELLLNYAASVNFPILAADRHYSFFPLPGGRFFFASEGFTAALLLIMSGYFLLVFLIYSVRHNAMLLFHGHLFLKSFWVFVIFFFLMVFSIKASGFLYSLLVSLLNAPYAGPNYAGVVLTMLLAVFIFLLPSPALSHIHFPGRARFYGFSAVVFIVVGIIYAALLDLSYVPLFIWAFFFIVLGTYVSNPILVFVFALAAPVFALNALRNIFEIDNGRIAELLISSDWKKLDNWLPSFQIALLSMPVLLLIRKGGILQKQKPSVLKPKLKHRLLVIPVLTAVLAGAMIVQILLVPERHLPPERRFIAESEDKTVKLFLEDVFFQESRILNLRMEARGNPIRFDVSLESGNEATLLPVYSAPVPFVREGEGKRVAFSLGENCPNPLTMEIVLPEKFEGLLNTEAVYNSWDPEIDPAGKPGSEDYVLKVSKSTPLGLKF